MELTSVGGRIDVTIDNWWPEELNNFAQDVMSEKLNEFAVLMEKQMDYGPKNISACPVGPERGVVVRLFDKLSRLGNLLDADREAKNEALEDTALDISNYGTILSMLLKGAWPNG